MFLRVTHVFLRMVYVFESGPCILRMVYVFEGDPYFLKMLPGAG